MYTNVFRCLKWIIEKFMEKKYLTLNDLNELWVKEEDLSDGLEMRRKTFYNHRKALKEKFGIDICQRDEGYAYYIRNPEIIRNNSLMNFMLSTLAMNEKLIDCKALMNRIVLESIPSGGEKLDVITDAMLKEFKLGFEYIRYGSSELKEHIAEVYGLVLYNQRWYILAGFGEEKKYTFALDRMKKVWMTKEKSYVDPAFDAVAYFDEFYGIYNSGREIMKIVIRTFGDESYYLRDLPIHKSQREIGSGDDYTDFMIELRPNKELISYLLSRKNRLKVLSPDCIVDEMKESIGEMLALYS